MNIPFDTARAWGALNVLAFDDDEPKADYRRTKVLHAVFDYINNGPGDMDAETLMNRMIDAYYEDE